MGTPDLIFPLLNVGDLEGESMSLSAVRRIDNIASQLSSPEPPVSLGPKVWPCPRRQPVSFP